MLKELNKKMEIIVDIERNTKFYAEKYDELLKQHKETLDMLKSTNNRLQDLQNRFVHLETVNEALECRVRNLEQAERGRNIEIVGVEQKENENIKDIITKIATKINVGTSEVERAWRLRNLTTKPAAKVPSPIIVKLRSEAAKGEWMQNRRLLKNNSDIFLNDSLTPIYINEDLTKYNKDLLWQARQKKKENIFKFVWVKKGRVLCKTDEMSRTLIIQCAADIQTYADKAKILPTSSQTPT